MKPVSDLKGCEQGKDIYVLASGKSMDFIPVAFFDDKVTIGSGDIFRRVKCKYYVRKERGGFPDAIKHGGTWILSRHDCGNTHFPLNHFSDLDYYVFDHICNDQWMHPEEIDTGRIVVSWSTITSAIHMAYYMGAKNIILCGADCGTIDGETNFEGYWIRGESFGIPDPEWYKNWLGQISEQTEKLADALRQRGVGVMSINPFVNYHLEGHTYE
jgi:hypothetical protein